MMFPHNLKHCLCVCVCVRVKSRPISHSIRFALVCTMFVRSCFEHNDRTQQGQCWIALTKKTSDAEWPKCRHRICKQFCNFFRKLPAKPEKYLHLNAKTPEVREYLFWDKRKLDVQAREVETRIAQSTRETQPALKYSEVRFSFALSCFGTPLS